MLLVFAILADIVFYTRLFFSGNEPSWDPKVSGAHTTWRAPGARVPCTIYITTTTRDDN